MKNDPAMFARVLVSTLILTTSLPTYVLGDQGENLPVQVEINPLISKFKRIIQFKPDTRFKRGDDANAKKPSLFLEFPESFFSDPKLMKLYSSLTGGAEPNSEPQITKLAFQIDPSRLGEASKRKKRKAHANASRQMSRSRRHRLANHFAHSVDSKFRGWSDKIDAEVAQVNSGRQMMERHHGKHDISKMRSQLGAPLCASTTGCTTTCPTTSTCPTTCRTTTTCPTTCRTTTTCPTTCRTTTTCPTTCRTTTKCPTTTCSTTCKTTTTCPTTCRTTTTCPTTTACTPSTCSTTCSTTRKITGCPRKNKPDESAKNFFGKFGHRSNAANVRKKRRFVRMKKNHRVASRLRKRRVGNSSKRSLE